MVSAMNVTANTGHDISSRVTPPAWFSFESMSDAAFSAWRQQKLSRVDDASNRGEFVTVANPEDLTECEREALHASIESSGYALYKLKNNDKSLVTRQLLRMLAQLGLRHLDKNRCAFDDGISRIQDDASGEQKHYIPYSNRALNWHTDGYYNPTDQRVKAFALHCIRPASMGGGSLFLDHEMLYLLVRQYNPALVKALFREDAMAIPVNSVDKDKLRAEQIGPVFWQDPFSGALQVRYTARTRSIRWSDDSLVQEAAVFIRELLADSTHVKRHKLQAGEGVIANNCLHARESFNDPIANTSKGRLLLRARFFDRASREKNHDNDNNTGSL